MNVQDATIETDASDDDARRKSSSSLSSIDKPAAVVYVGLHVGACSVFFVDLTPGLLALFVATYYARILGLTLAYHRYFAHRSFDVGRVTQFLLGLFGTLTIQRGPIWWAITHREHHKYADTENDIHSPRFQGVFYAHSLWFLDAKNRNRSLSEAPDLAAFRELRLLEHPAVFLSTIGGSVALLYWGFGAAGVAWGFFASTVASHHATHCIQSISHCWRGYRNYDSDDTTRNHCWIAWLTLGEYHNNHHFRPGSARQGLRRWEIDPTWHLILLLKRIGIVKRVRSFKDAEVTALRRTRPIVPPAFE
jgi:stearoyl-CoA desaturase (delta-9 desaturase)